MTAGSYSYPLGVVLLDYMRALLGLAVSAVPFAMGIDRPLVVYLFAGLACVFLAYGLRTLIRHRTRFRIGDEGIAVNLPVPRGISWSDVDIVRLRYYSLHRDRKRGWLHLVVGAGGTRISMDSSIPGFRDVVDKAVDAAGRNGLSLDDVTAANLASMADGAAEEAL